jgi:hypothetical protein
MKATQILKEIYVTCKRKDVENVLVCKKIRDHINDTADHELLILTNIELTL